jgi:hypothetical protein
MRTLFIGEGPELVVRRAGDDGSPTCDLLFALSADSSGMDQIAADCFARRLDPLPARNHNHNHNPHPISARAKLASPRTIPRSPGPTPSRGGRKRMWDG